MLGMKDNCWICHPANNSVDHRLQMSINSTKALVSEHAQNLSYTMVMRYNNNMKINAQYHSTYIDT